MMEVEEYCSKITHIDFLVIHDIDSEKLQNDAKAHII